MGKISGLRRYYGSEAGNVLLGQLGFDILNATSGTARVIDAGLTTSDTSAFGGTPNHDGTGAECWVCIQVNDPAGSCELSVKSLIGNDITDITFTDGIKIYGVFSAVKLTGVAGDSLICYRG